MIFFNF